MSGKKDANGKGNKLTRTRRTRSTKKVSPKTKAKSVSLAPYATNPMKGTRSKMQRNGASCRVHGTDFLTSVTIGASAAVAGDVLYTCVVNPAQLGVSRLATFARLYERYKFKSLKFRYSPVANATVTGQVIGYVDYDTYDDPTGLSGSQNLQRAAAHLGEKPVQVWQGAEKPVFWEIKDIDPLTDLYIDSDGSDPRWTDQGRFVLLAASGIAATTACGNIYLDYDIEFYIPQLEVTPNGGYANKYTGSTSCSTSAILGTAIAGSVWNNIPATFTGNTISVPAGSYMVYLKMSGTTISACGVTSTGTQVNKYEDYSASTTAASCFGYFYSTSPFTITFNATAASVTGGNAYLMCAPRAAVSVTERKLDRVTRLLRQFEFTKALVEESRSSGSDSKELKSVEEKKQELLSSKLLSLKVDKDERPPLTRFVTSMSCSSTSSSSSGSFPSVHEDLDEQYVRVPLRKS